MSGKIVSSPSELRSILLEDSDGAPLDQVQLTDQQRIGVVLQAAALLSQLAQGGWNYTAHWDEAILNRIGQLKVELIRGGRNDRLVQVTLRRLLNRLFHSQGSIAGRGTARTAARYLSQRWEQVLEPLSPDRATHEILQAAPFLWGEVFAPARAALVAEHSDGERRYLWVAGPGVARRRFLRRSQSRQQVEELLASPEARDIWDGWRGGSDPDELARRGRWNEAAVAWSREPPKGHREKLAFAKCLHTLGRHKQSLETLKGLRSIDAQRLRVSCQYFLGEHHAAQSALYRLAKKTLSAEQTVELAELAARILAARGQPDEARTWVERALSQASGLTKNNAEHFTLYLKAHLAAAGAAWDQDDPLTMGHHLEASRPALDIEELAGRWHHLRGLQAGLIKDGLASVQHVATALRLDRRRLSRFEAGRLWSDLAFQRGHADDLAGAERAAGHAARLLRDCDGPSLTTLALYNLAELRLRRGRGHNIETILEQSSAANEKSGNFRGLTQDLELWVRLELAQGRSAAAITRCSEAQLRLDRIGSKDSRSVFEVFAARAYGWLGRQSQAAECLARANAESFFELEPEERPAIWALAGHTDKAREEAAGTLWEPIWKAIIVGTHPAPSVWNRLQSLEPFRAARLIFDCELLLPGCAPAHLVREAIANLRQCNAGAFAERLESKSQGPWRVLESYLNKLTDKSAPNNSSHRATDCAPGLDNAGFEDLLVHAGYSDIHLVWHREPHQYVLVEGTGGDQQLSCQVKAGGSLQLKAPLIDDVLRCFLAVIARDIKVPIEQDAADRNPVLHIDGIIGESPALHQAIQRLDQLAGEDLPILLLGESGTGKELMARRAHRLSRRKTETFLPFNCAAVEESLAQSDLFGHVKGAFTGADRSRAGIFESARSGTVFLDEIGDLPLSAQGRLLRVLQEGEVRRIGESFARTIDVRVITATHRDLEKMVEAGEFRRDLYYRLRVATITLPPLRDRGKDIILLANHFLVQRRSERRLSHQAQSRLLSHRWPGNIRELQNILSVGDALATDREIQAKDLDLPESATDPQSDYHQMVKQYRRDLISKAMSETNDNRAAAARKLGLTRQALSYLVRELGLNK